MNKPMDMEPEFNAKGEASRFQRSGSLIEKFNISPAEFETRQQFLEFSEDDKAILSQLRPVVAERTDWIVDQFYAHLQKYNPLTALIHRAGTNVESLKVSQRKYLIELFSGTYDEAYLESRLRIGVVHFKVGLGPLWYLGSYSIYTVLLARVINRHYRFRLKKRARAMAAVNKILSLDSQIAIDSYLLSLMNQIRGTVNDVEGGIVAQNDMTFEQISAYRQTRDSLDEIEELSSRSLRMLSGWTDRAENTLQTGNQGLGLVKKAVETMETATATMGDLVANMTRLSNQTQQIASITDSVDALAKQSKSLAINASIEAVHAGEAGDGFSVVAAEVRSLADQSAQATLQVRQILGEIRASVDQAVQATDQSTRKIQEGADLVREAGSAVDTLYDAIRETAASSEKISETITTQAKGIENIGDAMGSLNQASDRMKSQSDKVNSSLAELAENLDRQQILAR